MSAIEAVLLGILQGLTEFLPVSSSGHLVLGKSLLRISNSDITFEVFVHFGTFLAVLIAFRVDIQKMIAAFFRWMVSPRKIALFWAEDVHFRVLTLILLGSVPAGMVGVLFEHQLEQFFANPFLVSIMLLVTGFILLSTIWTHGKRQRLSVVDSILIGVSQALAIIPGISRSGSTISTGMFLGIEKSEAARFSFLLSLPAIFGATLLKTLELIHDLPPVHAFMGLLLGTLSAAISGYLAILFLLRVVQRGSFQYFSIYCFLIGIVGIIYFI